mgnify:CR=1 FL=1
MYRGRGALICQTDQGLVLIKEFCGTPKKLEYQACLLSCIGEKSQVLSDEILPNQEGAYISADKDNISYVVKRWYEGKECDTRSEGDIYRGITAMADLHRVMQLPVQAHYVRQPLTTEFARHNAELRKIRKFVSAKRKKNEFELAFLDTIRRFLGHGEEALKNLAEKENAVGFLLPAMEKRELFPYVTESGTLLRKTFSMGHATEKRYYLEARQIR